MGSEEARCGWLTGRRFWLQRCRWHTGALMVLLRVSHPPAGATTLIVSLGILAKGEYLVVIEVAVILLTMQAFLINRLTGLEYPVWAKKATSPSAV